MLCINRADVNVAVLKEQSSTKQSEALPEIVSQVDDDDYDEYYRYDEAGEPTGNHDIVEYDSDGNPTGNPSISSI